MKQRQLVRSMIAVTGALAVASLRGASPKTAASSPPAPCSAPEFRQLDFWVGNWNATWPASPGSPAGKGTNRIEKILGGCVISENFEASGATPLIGKSHSTYSAHLKSWQQTWVDNQGSYLALAGDLSKEKILAMDSVAPNGKPVKLRMIFKNIAADSFDWSWERSIDNGASWQVQWPIHYTRKKA